MLETRTLWQGFVWRFIRTAASLIISAGVAYIQKDEKYIALAPIITATAKVARDYFNLKNLPL